MGGRGSRKAKHGGDRLFPRPNNLAWFEVPEKYYQRNNKLVEACDYLYAFISQEDGFIGGTRFEVEYALKLKEPVQFHWKNGISETFYQYPLQFMEREHAFFLH
jgi:nucleoside 2-deoxyribosyltransferase